MYRFNKTQKPPEVNWGGLVDEVLASELAVETRNEHPTVGLQERHFSEHSRNMAIIEGFDYDIEWVKAHPDLKELLDEEFDEWWEDEKDSHAFEQWWYGGRIELRADGYAIVGKLTEQYQTRIEDVHKCEDCGQEISEKYPRKHPLSLHRVGHRASGENEWHHSIYCRTCFRKKWGPRRAE